jgi:uncharacterized membrane protein
MAFPCKGIRNTKGIRMSPAGTEDHRNQAEGSRHEPGYSRVVDRNIRALLERRRQEEQVRSIRNRIAGAITAFAGSMTFVYLHLVLFGLWIIISLGWLPPLPRFDPTFVILAMFASVEAIFLSTFVLITQNRMAAQSDKKADLDLHISLLAEHEITRIISLLTAMAEKMGIDISTDTELSELSKDVRPEKILDFLEEQSQD